MTPRDDFPLNNPAGRVLAFLREFEAWAQQRPGESAMLRLTELLGEEQESTRIYLLMARLGMQVAETQV